MTNGVKALRRIQLGQEVSAGGSTDIASTVWRGTGVIVDNRETTFPVEDIGILGGTSRSYVAMTGGEIALEGDATFEQLPHIFNAGIYKATPTTDVDGSGYIYSYNMQAASTDPIEITDLQTYVIEGGDNNEAEIMRYCFVRQFSLSGGAGEALQVSAQFEGREVEGDYTYTAGVAIPTVETILFSKATVYIDAATVATTDLVAMSNTVLAMNLDVTTGWQAVRTADGRLDFSFIKRAADSGTLQITFEHNASASLMKEVWRDQEETRVRIVFEGSALTTAGAYTYKTFIIDAYGKWESFDSLGEQDGNDIVTGTLRIAYTQAAKKLDLIVVNELAAMP